MNFKYWINKWLESGLWYQILFFTIINFGVFLIGFLLYSSIGFRDDVKLWETLRLFINSNSILENTHEFVGNHVVLLFIECLGNIFFSGLIISISAVYKWHHNGIFPSHGDACHAFCHSIEFLLDDVQKLYRC